MKKWELQNEFKINPQEFETDDLIEILLENRGIKTKKEIDQFLNPTLENLTPENLGISQRDLEKSVKRINTAIKNKEQIIVFGDYDVDGVVGSAIIWESLNTLGVNILPYIPHRTSEGYGLSKKGIENLIEKYPETKLIITVDNGIVANEAVEFAGILGLEVIITDHHTPGAKNPKAFAIIHSTKICGAAVGWFFTRQFKNKKENDHLGLVSLATVADVMPLNGFNRTFVKQGLVELRKTKRPGIVELLKLAGVSQEKIGVYELGFIIGPRLNATGRIEHAMDSLRFLCTPNLKRAKELAQNLHITNVKRQQMTLDSVIHAKNVLKEKKDKLIFIADESYQPGVIGLISGRITEEYYRPSIVVSKGEELSKGSARSIAGFNIIDFIRKFSDLLVDKGGHPMAAGFTIRTRDVSKLQKMMTDAAEKDIDEKLLIRKLKIDCEFPIEFISLDLFEKILKLNPFGYGNPEPTFLAKGLEIAGLRFVGAENKHLKLELADGEKNMGGILFGAGESMDLKIGDTVDTVYNISLNEWNGNKKLELKVKDIRKT